jgi:hypothetical protein
VPLPKVRGIAEEEMFKVVKTGKKTAKKGTSHLLFLRAPSNTHGNLYGERRCPRILSNLDYPAIEGYCVAEQVVRYAD